MNKFGLIGAFIAGTAIGGIVGYSSAGSPDAQETNATQNNTPTEEPEVLEYFYDNGQLSLREEIVGRNWGEPTDEENGLVGYSMDEDFEMGTLLLREWFTPDGHLMARTDYECDECEYGFFFNDDGALRAAMIFKDDLAYGPAMFFEPPVKPTRIVHHGEEGSSRRELVLNEEGEYVEAPSE